MTKHIYIFSGLGADEKAFQRLDFSGYEATFVRWTKPKEDDTIESYAVGLLDQVKTPSPVLIGLSFGGLMAIEVAKHIATEKILLISSAKTRREIPLHFRIAGKLGLHKLIPYKTLKKPNAVTNFLFGAHSKADKKLLAEMLANTDIPFMKWALDKITSWKNNAVPDNVIHIHGTADKILLYYNIRSDYTIDNGEHLMVLNRSAEVNEIVRNELRN